MEIALIEALKGASPFDIIIALSVIILTGGFHKLYKKKKNNPNSVRHALCIREIEDIEDQRMDIKYRRLIYEQMRVVESAILAIQRSMADTFFKELQKYDMNAHQVNESMDWRYYQTILELLGCRIKEDVRTMVKINGLADKTEAELAEYLEDKFGVIKETTRTVFNVYYGNQLNMDRTDLFRMHKTIEDFAYKKFTGAMRECRQIYIQTRIELDRLDAKKEVLRSTPCE